jgi:hypothetical protein
VIVAPPLEAGAVHVKEAEESKATATTLVGAPGLPGVPEGVTAVLAVEAGPVPLAFVAVTVNV